MTRNASCAKSRRISGCQASGLVEKDLHVVRAIAAVAAIDATPFTLVFGGGTALARAHKLVRRMSEDVDFKIVPQPAAPVSRIDAAAAARRAARSVTQALQAAGFAFDRNGHSPHQITQREPLHGLAAALRQRRRGRGGASPDDPDRDDLCPAAATAGDAAGQLVRGRGLRPPAGSGRRSPA